MSMRIVSVLDKYRTEISVATLLVVLTLGFATVIDNVLPAYLVWSTDACPARTVTCGVYPVGMFISALGSVATLHGLNSVVTMVR